MAVKIPHATEAQWQRTVIEYAQLRGWRVAHFRTALSQSGRWVTPVAATGAGFPDLVLVRYDQVMFVELKSQVGRLSNPQKEWIAALNGVQLTSPHAVTVHVWRPSDWPEVERDLR